MPVRDAVRLLFAHRITGAPVVDPAGRCIGAVSRSDFASLGLQHGADAVTAPARPISCDFQFPWVGPDGREKVTCTLPARTCPYQRLERDAEGHEIQICCQPHCVSVDWQVVQFEKLGSDAVNDYMTPGPVVATSDAPVRTLARQMVDARIHRIFVVDAARRPIGVVTSTDLLAALAGAADDEALLSTCSSEETHQEVAATV
jgi:CBS domain-containing protein